MQKVEKRPYTVKTKGFTRKNCNICTEDESRGVIMNYVKCLLSPVYLSHSYLSDANCEEEKTFLTADVFFTYI